MGASKVNFPRACCVSKSNGLIVLCTLLRALVGERPLELEEVSSGGMLRVVTTCVTVFEKKTSSRWESDVRHGWLHGARVKETYGAQCLNLA